MVFLVSSVRQLAPGILLIVVLMPIWARLSWTSTQSGSLTTAKPRSNEIVVSKPSGKPASVSSALALAMSVKYLVGCGHATSVVLVGGAPNIGLARPNSTASTIFWYGIA